MGQNFIYYTITNFNPLVLTTVTTTRKIFTTVYSVFRDPSNSLNTAVVPAAPPSSSASRSTSCATT